MKKSRVIIPGILALLVMAGILGYRYWPKGGNKARYKLASVERGDLVQTVRATGGVQPIRLVQVGTQVNGPVRKLYVDYNDIVKEGQIVAQIDPTVYEARYAQAQAGLAQSSATVEQTRTRLAEAQREWQRAVKLAERQMVSEAELDTATAAYDALVAQVKVAEASVEQAKASLRLSKADLDYTTIRSPVDGVVVARNVDEGQTVVASLSAQVLFQIATDLRMIQVEASIPEADIGKIKVGQPVTFTVDAHDQTFTGTVNQVRLAASTVQNVVTYPVVILADNPEGRLFPGMTANIICEVARRESVLQVPNAALRFKPEQAATGNGGGLKSNNTARSNGSKGHSVWIQDPSGAASDPIPVPVFPGISDGANTEIRTPTELREGQKVLTGILAEGAKQDEVVNPFTPRMPRGARPPR